MEQLIRTNLSLKFRRSSQQIKPSAHLFLIGHDRRRGCNITAHQPPEKLLPFHSSALHQAHVVCVEKIHDVYSSSGASFCADRHAFPKASISSNSGQSANDPKMDSQPGFDRFINCLMTINSVSKAVRRVSNGRVTSSICWVLIEHSVKYLSHHCSSQNSTQQWLLPSIASRIPTGKPTSTTESAQTSWAIGWRSIPP